MSLKFGPLGPCLILMADDDDNDVFLFRRVLSQSDTPHSLVHVKDGFEALRYLRGEDPYHDRASYPEPHLVVLDLKMPHMSGFDVLQAVRWDDKLSKVVIVVLSGSDIAEDEKKSLELGARAFFTKPFGMQKMARLAEVICKLWLPSDCNEKTADECKTA